MSVEQLTRQLAWGKKQTAYAWAKYYESERTTLGDNIQQYERVNGVMLDEVDNLDISKCGHKYCKECLGRLKQTTKKCAVCRRKLCK